jgi:hypothetical protein
MDVERQRGRLAHELDHRWAEGEVGHEVAVHHVDVDPIGAGVADRAHLLGEPAEVGAEDRGRDQRPSRHRRPAHARKPITRP